MKIALVHDYLTEYGGAERVLEAMHELWPEAPVFTSICDKSILLHSDIQLTENVNVVAGLVPAPSAGDHKGRNYRWDIRSSRVSTLPLASRLAKSFTFFMPLVFENMDLREYDVVISDGTIWSKSVLTTPEQLHIFYCHTPPRWLYGYPGETDRRRLWYLQPLLKPLDNWLRVWDFETAQRPDFIVANSKTTAARIRKFWRKEAEVIYPPVTLERTLEDGKTDVLDLEILSSGNLDQDIKTSRYQHQGNQELSNFKNSRSYFLVVSRLSAYKNVDLAIRACNERQLPLVVVGTGREEEWLKEIAGPTVKFLKNLPDAELAEIYQNCRALIHPASDEDFGLAPVEAMSFGKPVIALRGGGVTETVIEGKTGVFFNEPTTAALIKTMEQFNHLTINSNDCIERAQKFSKERFRREFKNFVEEKLREFKNSSKIKAQ